MRQPEEDKISLLLKGQHLGLKLRNQDLDKIEGVRFLQVKQIQWKVQSVDITSGK